MMGSRRDSNVINLGGQGGWQCSGIPQAAQVSRGRSVQAAMLLTEREVENKIFRPAYPQRHNQDFSSLSPFSLWT